MIGNETRKKYALVRNTAILNEIVLTMFLYKRTAEHGRFSACRRQYLKLGNMGVSEEVLVEFVLTTVLTKLLPSGRREERLSVGDFVLFGDGT
jgi:hypothetical protein